MAVAHSTEAVAVTSPDDIVVVLNPCDLDFSEFLGTRAMLEAEGIIPDGTEWPEGYDNLRWESGRFSYWLKRQRPCGAKGPRKQFMDCDWWCVRQELTVRPSFANQQIAAKAKALTEEIYRHSAQGQAEWRKQWDRYWEAERDKSFQAFKALVPALVRRKRGRRASEAT